MTEPKNAKTRYKTTNWAAYNAALKARGSLTIWLDKDTQWYAPASGQRGRQRLFSEAAIPFCLSIKCLFGLALRQSLGTVESLLRLAGLDWRVPDFSTVCRRQETLRLQLPYRASTTALDLLVDSTEIKFLGKGEWRRKEHGAEYRRQWRKVHLGIDAHTLEIRAIQGHLQQRGRRGLRHQDAPCGDPFNAGRRRGLPRARTGNRGRRRWWARACATRRSKLVTGWGTPSASSGAVTTAEAWVKTKMHCFKRHGSHV